MEWMVDDMKSSDYEPYRILGTMKQHIVYISFINFLGERTFSHTSMTERNKMILDKVLSDERSTAYATTIDDINRWWSDCQECNWYKSKETILSEARSLL